MNMETKKAFWHAAIAAIAICSFSACASSEEDELQNSGNERGVVKTEFTISFPQKMGNATRQSITVVQGQSTPVFRGINSISLRPFTATKENITSSTVLPSPLNFTGTDIVKGTLYSLNNSHLYKDVEIGIGTRSFMFYGCATAETAPNNITQNALNGSLTPNTTTPTGTLADISFTPTPIYNEMNGGTTLVVPTYGKVIAAYLTAIANAKVDDTHTWANSYELGTLYTEFVGINAGSWISVQKAVQQLYTTVYSRTEPIAAKIREAILASLTVDDTSYTLATDNTGEGGTTTGTLTFTSLKNDYGEYPANIGLPDGAAYVKWNATSNAFAALTTSDAETTVDNGGMNFSSLNKYCYPASLYYNGLSNIKTSESSKETEYKNDVTWSAILNTYTDDTGVVSSKTRSIAIIEPVQYAVGRLDVAVQTNGGTSSLKDNDKDGNGKDITVGNNFPITGILVGNQKAVDYKFETTATTKDTEASKMYTIYDSQIPTTEGSISKECRMVAGTINESDYNKYCTHTLVLETADATSADDYNNVAIAVEFQNNSEQIIVGKDKKLIYPGTKFYLVGILKPFNNNDVKYKSSHLPTGKTTNNLIKRAFVQDYTTKVTFNVHDLKKAYNVVPDLRNPNLEIGVSVDLNWAEGITQTIEIQ